MRDYEFAFILRVDCDTFRGVEVVDTMSAIGLCNSDFIGLLSKYEDDNDYRYYLVYSYANSSMFGDIQSHYHCRLYYHNGSRCIGETMDNIFWGKCLESRREEYTQVYNVAKCLWHVQVFEPVEGVLM